jgi:hypothetical protein
MAGGAESSSREEMERLLRNALETAKREHQDVKAECARLQAIHEELGENHPDALAVLGEALERERLSLERYHRAIIDFGKFILYGRIPE